MYTQKEFRQQAERLTISAMVKADSPLPEEAKRKLKEIAQNLGFFSGPIGQAKKLLPFSVRREVLSWLWFFVRHNGLPSPD